MVARCKKCGELIWVTAEEVVARKILKCGHCNFLNENPSFDSIHDFIEANSHLDEEDR
jgi:phage FluMu protein Com